MIALGGNAIQSSDRRGVEDQWRAVSNAMASVSEVIAEGHSVVLTHGNGPQVGFLLEAFDSLPMTEPRPTLDLAVAMTQGWIGFMMAHALERELTKRGVRKRAVVVPTRVIVNSDDPQGWKPTKPIGRSYTREEAEVLSKRMGWIFKEDPRGGYRRVVPSPMPVKILEVDTISALLQGGFVPIAAGGGGIPLARSNGELRPVEAVVDKDLASSLLAVELRADKFVVLTDVGGVAINYKRLGETWLRRASTKELRKLYEEGQFPPGSMGPKVLSCIKFVEATGKECAIGHLEDAYRVIKGEAGTTIGE
ncbi:MAG: carbamate kinase [Acidilobaceae archaeon]|nr:carbamate kinase [Acidilobaceae archaeon]MDW7974137.1 carbamate kinase [Sulfolobales archaeon]